MNRRLFINNAAKATAAVATLSTSKLFCAADTKPYKMTVNLVPGMIGVRVSTQAELNALAVKHGFESVEARGRELATMSDRQVEDLLADMKKNGIVFGACGLPVDFRGDDAGFNEGLKGLPKISDGLQRVGVTRVNTWLSPSHSSLTYLQNFKMHAKRLREVAKVLKDRDQRLGLEYVGTRTLLVGKKYPFVHTMAEARDLIDEIGTGNVGFVLDSWHWWQAGDSEEDIRFLTNDEVIAVDLNDAPSGVPKTQQRDNQRELPMATGVIKVKVFLNALNHINYDGPVRAEPFNAPLNQMDNDAACSATSAAIRKAFASIG